MKCKNCETELPDGAKFCGKCGELFQDEDYKTDIPESEEPPKKSVKSNKKKVILIIAAVICVLVIGAISACQIWLYNMDQKFIKQETANLEALITAVENRDFDRIKELGHPDFHASDVDPNSLYKLECEINNASREIYEAVQKGELSGGEAMNRLNTLKNCYGLRYGTRRDSSQQTIQPDDYTSKMIEIRIHQIICTDTTFKKAKEYQDKGEYKLAIEEYKKIPLAAIVTNQSELCTQTCKNISDCMVSYAEYVIKKEELSSHYKEILNHTKNILNSHTAIIESDLRSMQIFSPPTASLTQNSITDFNEDYFEFITDVNEFIAEYDVLLAEQAA